MGMSEDLLGRGTARVAGIVEQMDKRITLVEDGLLNLGNRLDSRIDRLEDKMDVYFRCLIGIQVSTLVAVISVLIGVIWKMSSSG